MASRPITQPNTYGTIVGNAAMSLLDTSFAAVFTSGFNDSALGWVNYAVDTGTTNNYAVTLTQAPSTYTSGMCLCFSPINSCTGASTINVNALGTKNIVNAQGQAVTPGCINKGQALVMVYDGTSFRIVSYCPLTYNNSTQGSPLTLNCDGFHAVSFAIGFTVSITINLVHLSIGTPVQMTLTNNSASIQTVTMTATTPDGASYSLSGKTAGSAIISFASFNIGATSAVLWCANSSLIPASTPQLLGIFN